MAEQYKHQLGQLEFVFEPIPYKGKDDTQWYPSVRVTCNGEFYSWQVFMIGFDDPKYTMPYAREFCREMRDMKEAAFALWIAGLRN